MPERSEDLRGINPRYNNIIILDDLMAEATDSPVVSRLFTQGRHRNASVILLVQNVFPKAKYNTDISQNAQYLALFQYPSGRKQIGIIGEGVFDKNRAHFMKAYYKETENRLDTYWWIISLTHHPISKFLQTYLGNAMFITSL